MTSNKKKKTKQVIFGKVTTKCHLRGNRDCTTGNRVCGLGKNLN
jgi:hypothetical protein